MASIDADTRAAIATSLLRDQATVRTCMRQYKVSRSTVQRIRSEPYLQQHGRGGSWPRIDFDRLRRHLNRAAPATSDRVQRWLRTTCDVDVTIRTVRRYLKQLGYTPHKERIVPASSHAHAQLRHEFAVRYRRSNLKDWIFEDECTLVLRDTGRIVWTQRGSGQPERQVKGIRSAVQLVGCIWWNGHFFRRFAGYMNETKYMDFLQAGLAACTAGWRRKSLLHDQASYHTTESVENWFADRGINLITNAPKAPKWNAIEYVWKWIKE